MSPEAALSLNSFSLIRFFSFCLATFSFFNLAANFLAALAALDNFFFFLPFPLFFLPLGDGDLGILTEKRGGEEECCSVIVPVKVRKVEFNSSLLGQSIPGTD